MTKEDFIKECSARGICPKAFARGRTKGDPADKDYTEDDIIEMHRKKDIYDYRAKHDDFRYYDGAKSTKRLKNRSAPNYL